jgi:RNA polymerase sigma-70 factor (ECF subfamily)
MAEGDLVNQFLENRDPILGFIVALTRDYDVAEEIFQEVAKVILEEAKKSISVSHFMPWAREIARRRVSEFYRKQTRRHAVEKAAPSMEEVICQAFTENEKTLEISHLRMKALMDCLRALPDRSRKLVEGFYRQGQSIRDLAGNRGWTEPSVKNALWRTRKALAECIRNKLVAHGLT